MSVISILEIIGEALTESIQFQLSQIKLKDSNIYKNVSYSVDSKNNILKLNIASYWIYIEEGRKALTKKVPIFILLKWLKRKNIQSKIKGVSLNQLAFMIQNSIYKKGIKARPFLAKAYASVDASSLIEIEISRIIDDKIKKIF